MHYPQSVFLFDIEGTTTAISFVTSTLFPFAAQQAERYLEENYHAIPDLIKAFRSQALSDIEAGRKDAVLVPERDRKAVTNAVVKNIRAQISADRKITALKDLQGMIWVQGYGSGELKGHMFDDVRATFEHLKKIGKNVHIYSSGSVQAQKLIFGHSVQGDLTPFISGYFDTNIGHKSEHESYLQIALSLSVNTTDICFLTDRISEAFAAKRAGCRVIVLNRPGNPPTETHDFELWSDFSGLLAATS